MASLVDGNITLSGNRACVIWNWAGTQTSTEVLMYRMMPKLPKRKNRSVKKVGLTVAPTVFLIYILVKKFKA